MERRNGQPIFKIRDKKGGGRKESAKKMIPEQMWDAAFWVIVISAIGGWAMLLAWWAYKFFIEDKVK